MGPSLYWSVFVVVTICPLAMGAPAPRQCSEENLSIAGGDYTLTKDFSHGSVLIYRCPEGFYPYPAKVRRCHNGTWKLSAVVRSRQIKKRSAYECRMVTCPDPVGFQENGEVSPSQIKYFVNNRTTYTCYSDYKLRGSASRVCQANGKWSGATPICGRDADHCPDPGTPPGTRRTGRIFNIDDKVTYRCEGKLTLLGSKERVCQESGEWTGTEPECYYEYTYDTPEEVTEAFGNSLSNSLKMSEIEDGNQTQHGKQIRLDQGGKLNIYIALDVSDSIEEEDFEESKQLIRKLIEKISYFEVTPNYEILVFATDVTEIVNIVDFYSGRAKRLTEILEDLANVDYNAKGDKTGTNIAKAFTTILERISFVRENTKKAFEDIRHVIIMFTDGFANMGGDPKPVVAQIKQLVYQNQEETRDDYLDMYAFGVGEEVNKEDLDHLVTKKNDEHLFILKNLEDMQRTFDEMIDESTSVSLCGLHKDYDSGTASSVRRRHPWLAKIVVTRGGKLSNCLGSLVTPRFVLTAAHCFKFGDNAKNIQVEIEDGTKRKVKEVKRYIPHPQFNITAKVKEGIPEFYDYDVALIELIDDVKISVDARTICIPCTMEANGALKLSGVDVTCKQQEEILLKKQYEQAAFMTKDEKRKDVTIKLGDRRHACVEDAKKASGITAQNAKDIVTDNFLCTGGIEGNADHVSCKGDSGGATFVERDSRLIQVGVVSWGVKDMCTQSMMPTSDETSRDYHINLFKVQPFLKEHLGDTTQTSYAPLTFLED